MIFLDGMIPDILVVNTPFLAPEGKVVKCIKCFESASIKAEETRGKDHCSNGDYATGNPIASLPGDEIWGNFSEVTQTSGGYVRIWIASANDRL